MIPYESRIAELSAKVAQVKGRLGTGCVVLAHHYQRPEVVAAGDFRGDSLGLSRQAAASEASHIVFCGVRFMAESAYILARPGQTVLHPDPSSGCPMSDMADIEDVDRAFAELDETCGAGSFIPVTYVNSSAAVKAATGARGGICCTSSNALKVMKSVMETGKTIVFLPDEHLGANTARVIGFPEGSILRWDYSLPFGGNSQDGIRRARLILWAGHCHVHTWFNTGHVAEARRRFPGARVMVHPECRSGVVMAADASGSTEFMVNTVRESPAGSAFVIGTELNLVRRLAAENPGKTVVELSRSMCPNMFKITLNKVLYTLEHLDSAGPVTVPEETRHHARQALQRMLDLS
ncbi:MAG: quinolinate synthase NadA [Myxococcota bacterium]